MNDTVTVALAQLNLLVGDVSGNTARIIEYSRRARDELRADLVVFPELSLSGYPPQDLLSHSGLRRRVDEALSGVMNTVEMPDRIAQDLVMLIRQNSGTLSKKRRNKEFKKLTDGEVVTIEGTIRAAFDEYDTEFGARE